VLTQVRAYAATLSLSNLEASRTGEASDPVSCDIESFKTTKQSKSIRN
jgi:hypothetical protein